MNSRLFILVVALVAFQERFQIDAQFRRFRKISTMKLNEMEKIFFFD